MNKWRAAPVTIDPGFEVILQCTLIVTQADDVRFNVANDTVCTDFGIGQNGLIHQL